MTWQIPSSSLVLFLVLKYVYNNKIHIVMQAMLCLYYILVMHKTKKGNLQSSLCKQNITSTFWFNFWVQCHLTKTMMHSADCCGLSYSFLLLEKEERTQEHDFYHISANPFWRKRIRLACNTVAQPPKRDRDMIPWNFQKIKTKCILRYCYLACCLEMNIHCF